ncbi:MAG TPA: hypothetical protein VKQ70_00985 [Caulobacteraceae bacterium]|nr:hypothetical protein [Caulobacteraceae bacterium]
MACALAGACLVAGGAVADEFDDGAFAMPREVVSAATVFQTYMSNAARIGDGFSSGDGVERGLKAGASYQTAQLEEGMIAYGAIAALQDDRFVDGVLAAAGHGDQRTAFAEQLIEDPYVVTRVDGASGAGERVAAALAAEAEPVVSAGDKVKSAAYSVQHQAWSKATVADAPARLAEVKSLSAVRDEPSEADNQAMMQALGDADPDLGSGAAPSRFTAIEAKALALAAESVLGHAQGADRDRLTPLLSENDSAFCLKMAKLNLYQCMAVAGPQYEDIFCLGQHAIHDTGQCVDQAANGVGAAKLSTLSPRAGATPASFTRLAAHRTLRIDP